MTERAQMVDLAGVIEVMGDHDAVWALAIFAYSCLRSK
jgi:hypothetical protein